jgi:hypothetical protein
MIGIGHKQEKYTKIKILAEKAKDYNQKYDELIAQGLDPQEVASRLQKEEYEKRHLGTFVEEPYKVRFITRRSLRKSTKSEAQCTSATPKPTRHCLKRRPSTPPFTTSCRPRRPEPPPTSISTRRTRNSSNSTR